MEIQRDSSAFKAHDGLVKGNSITELNWSYTNSSLCISYCQS